MPFVGGVYTPVWQWQVDQLTYPNILATRMDTYLNDMATGLNLALLKDGSNVPTASLPMAGYVHTGVGNATARTQYVAMGQYQDGSGVYYADTGTASAYVITPIPAVTAYTAGQRFHVKIKNAATGASTLAVSGLPAVNIVNPDASAIANGQIVANQVLEVIYDGTNFQVQSPTVVSVPAGSYASAGDMKTTAASTAPNGWLLAYGQALSRSTYAALYAAIGTTYGAGDGSTTFNVPDMRGRTAFGMDTMGGTAANRLTTAGSSVDGTTLGAVGGNQSMQSHTHTATVTDPGHGHSGVVTPNGGQNVGSASAPAVNISASTANATTGITVANASTGNGASQNIPPAIVLNWLIKF